MGRTTWSGPLRVGNITGVSAERAVISTSGISFYREQSETNTSVRAAVAVTQMATVNGNASGATNIFLPANSDVIEWRLTVVCAASAATSTAVQGLNFRIGRVAGNDAYFATIKVSGIGHYTIPQTTFNPPGNFSAAGNLGTGHPTETQVFVDATAVTSASATGQLGARLYVTYFTR